MSKLKTQARKWADAKEKQQQERAKLIALVHEANDAGMSEYELMRECGVTRSTIRDWLGKLPNLAAASK